MRNVGGKGITLQVIKRYPKHTQNVVAWQGMARMFWVA